MIHGFFELKNFMRSPSQPHMIEYQKSLNL